MAFLENLKNITTFIFDIDGVLTDGMITATESGEYLRTFNIKDGYAMQLAVKRGYRICIISGARGISLEKRFTNLGIADYHLGISEKYPVFENFIKQASIDPASVLYVGDDIPDRGVMQAVGIAVCPADAVEEIKAVAHFTSPHTGGKGVVRDVIEKVLKVQGRWHDPNPSARDSAN